MLLKNIIKRILCLLLLISSLSFAQTITVTTHNEFERDVIHLYLKLNKFIKEYEGCPLNTDDFGLSDCKEENKKLNQKTFEEAREIAKKLFDLEEKKK